jgi:hypothetical protein
LAGLRDIAASHNFTCTHELNSPDTLVEGKSASLLGNAETDHHRTSICRITGINYGGRLVEKGF